MVHYIQQITSLQMIINFVNYKYSWSSTAAKNNHGNGYTNELIVIQIAIDFYMINQPYTICLFEVHMPIQPTTYIHMHKVYYICRDAMVWNLHVIASYICYVMKYQMSWHKLCLVKIFTFSFSSLLLCY